MTTHVIRYLHCLIIQKSCNRNEPKVDTAATTDGMAFIETLMTRTSIRQYTDQTVSDDTIETLFHAGMAAPTLNNS